jgi:hypothetical protein
MDSLSLIGIPLVDVDIKKGLDWFITDQQADGLWKISYSKIHKAPENIKSGEETLWEGKKCCVRVSGL